MYVLIVAKYRDIYEYTEKWTEFVKCDDYDELSSDSNKLAEHIGFDEIDAILYQMQLMQNDIDELRRYIVSAELLLPDTIGDSIPTSDPASAGQLWNNRGVLSVSRG